MDSEIPSIARIAARALRIRLADRRPRCRSQAPKRILVAPHLRLGDAILVTPLLAKLRDRYPTAEIVLISPIPMIPLYQRRPFGVVVWPYHPRRFATCASMISQDGFDLAVIPGDNRHGWLAAALRSRWIVAHVGDRPQIKSWLIDELIPYPTAPKAMGDIFAELVPGPPPRAYRPDDWPAPACNPFDLPAAPYAVLHVGASSVLKLWQPEKWRRLAHWLDKQSLRVVWSAGSGEGALVKLIDPDGHYETYMERLDLAQMWRLIANAAIFISPDTGVAHLARLTGTPSVALFGPGSVSLFGRGHYWGDLSCAEVTVEDFLCRNQRDIFRRERPWIQQCHRSPSQCDAARCMVAIDATAVIEAVQQLLDGDRAHVCHVGQVPSQSP